MVSGLHKGLMAVGFAALMIVPAGTASAQGFFQNFFGMFSQPKPQPQAQPRALPPPDYRQRPQPGWNRAEEIEAAPRSRNSPRSGQYRTLCVRMCDGFYWPINFRSSRDNFYQEANRCKSSCASPARLFYHDNTSGDPGTMIDLAGRAYSRLPTAFQYRKTRIPGCTCKPEPWSQSEINRHAGYAAAATGEGDKPSAQEDLDAGKGLPEANMTPVAEVERSAADRKAVDTAEPATPPTEPPQALPVHRASTTDRPARNARSRDQGSRPSPPSQISPPRAERRAAQRRPADKPQSSGLFGFGPQKYRWPGD